MWVVIVKQLISLSRIFIAIRILLASIFVLSGVLKLIDINSFAKALGAFKLLTETQLNIMIYVIPILELVLALGLLAGIKTHWFGNAITLMLLGFTAVLLAKIFEGEEISCNCFGALSSGKIDYTTIIRNLILTLMSITLTAYYSLSESKTASVTFNVVRSKLFSNLYNFLFVGFIFFLVFQSIIFGLQNRELKNRILLITSDQETLKEGEKARTFIAKDLSGSDVEIKYDVADRRNTLFFLMSVKCQPCKTNFRNWINLADYLNDKDMRIVCVAIDSVKEVQRHFENNKPNFDVYSNPSDEFKIAYKGFITPQTILISPGGTVIKAWTSFLNDIKIDQILKQSGIKKNNSYSLNK